MNTIRFHFMLLLSLAALALGGCNLFNRPPALAGAGMDMFTPVKMRLHPLTRVTSADNASTVEARIELTDQFDDICKGAGTVYFELFTYETLVPNHHGERVGFWNFDLSKPEANKEHWDGITRTYLCKLPLPAAGLKKQSRLVLSATWALPNGARLTDEMPISLK